MGKKKAVKQNIVGEFIPDQTAVLSNQNNILYRLYKQNIINKQIIEVLCGIKNIKYNKKNIEQTCSDIDFITVDDVMSFLDLEFYEEEGTLYTKNDYNDGKYMNFCDFFLWTATQVLDGYMPCMNGDELDLSADIISNPFKNCVDHKKLESEYKFYLEKLEGDGSNFYCELDEDDGVCISFCPPGVVLYENGDDDNGVGFRVSMHDDNDIDIQEICNYIDEFKNRFKELITENIGRKSAAQIYIANIYKILVSKNLSLDFERILEYLESDDIIYNELENLTNQKNELEKQISKLQLKVKKD